MHNPTIRYVTVLPLLQLQTSQMRGQTRGDTKGPSNNINININLSVKDPVKPSGKKIENSIKVGTSAMETKRMTMLTQRLKDRKKEIEGMREEDEGEYVRARITSYTAKKQRSKTGKNLVEQIPSAFSTTKLKSKFTSRDVRDLKETPVKLNKTKQEDLFSRQKRVFSNEKLKSRRNSTRGGNSTENLRRMDVHKSPSKSDKKSGSRSASKSSIKHKVNIFKKKEKTDLAKSAEKNREGKEVKDGQKSARGKQKVSHKGKDDHFVSKPPVKKQVRGKSIVSSTIDVPTPLKASNQKPHKRKPSLTLIPRPYNPHHHKKSSKQHSPDPSTKPNRCALKIQRLWRGHNVRQKLLSQFIKLNNHNTTVKAQIAGNQQEFWGNSSSNSIHFLNVSIEDSFSEASKPHIELFSGEEVLSVEASTDELNPFDRLIKISQKVGDQKLARQLRDMAQTLMKEELEKNKIIRENNQLKQDIVHLKEESIHQHVPQQPEVEEVAQPLIRMPVKIDKTEEKQEHKHLEVEFHSAKVESSPQQVLEKKKMIEQLRSFKGESDGMMKKIQKGGSPEKKTDVPEVKKPIESTKEQPKPNPNPKSLLPQILKQPFVISPREDDDYDEEFQDFGQTIKKSQSEYGRKSSLEFLKESEQRQVQKEDSILRPPSLPKEILNIPPSQSSQWHLSESSEGNPSQLKNQELNEEPTEKKGFQTNLNFVKEYCIGLCEYIRGNKAIKNRFKEEIMKPLKLDLSGFLKSYRKTVEGEVNAEYNSFKWDYEYPFYRETISSQGLIKQETFKQFNETLSTLKANSPDADPQDIQLQQIHLKSLLEVFNESLNHERPSGVHGQSLPWAPQVKYLKNINNTFDEDGTSHSPSSNSSPQYSRQNEKFDTLFGVSIARVIQWGSSLCGFIPESLDMDVGIHVDEEYINHIKETRMALMLEKTLAEDEEKMLEFTDFETEVKLEIGSGVWEDLLEEVLEEMRGLGLGVGEGEILIH